MATENLFVIRNYNNEDLDTAQDLVAANRRSREFTYNVKVYKRTPEGDVLMSYTGPRDNELK